MVKRILRMGLSLVPSILICGGAGLTVFADVVVMGGHCAEDALVETMQFMAVLLAGLIVLGLAWRHREWRGGFVLISAFFIDMALREQDAFFDHIFHGAWVIPVGVVTLAAFVVAWSYRDTVIPALEKVFRGRGFPALSLGMFIVIGFSRIFGYKGIWKALGDYEHLHVAKRTAEESTELLGYTIIFGWAMHLLVTINSKEEKQ